MKFDVVKYTVELPNFWWTLLRMLARGIQEAHKVSSKCIAKSMICEAFDLTLFDS